MELCSKNLTVRNFRESDFDALFSLLSDPDVMRYLEPVFTRGRASDFLHSAGMCGEPLIYAVCRGAEFAGYIIYHPYEDIGYELGWVIARRLWGNRFAEELTALMLDYSRGKTDCLIIECAPKQRATAHIAQKCGFTYLDRLDGRDRYVYRFRGGRVMLETRRLLLREFVQDDFGALSGILSDAENMRYYPAAFDAQKVRGWIAANIRRYREDGFGLWAVVLKDSGRLIGDCGVTMQNINGAMLPEIGYHIHRDYQRQGYAAEAAASCRDFVFENTDFDAVYSYMMHTNEPSLKTALSIGMRFVLEFDDPINVRTRVYAISRGEWEKRFSEDIMKKYDAVVFDLDGTLLDTLEDLTDSVNYALELYGAPARTVKQVRETVGHGLRNLVENSFGEHAAGLDMDEVFARFSERYAQNCNVKTMPYGRIVELLTRLQGMGIKIAVVSNKAQPLSRLLCEAHFGGLAGYVVGARDGVERKPSPQGTLEALSAIGAKRAVYVGDSDVDIQTAANAGLDAVIVDWGFRDRAQLEAAGAKTIISKPLELLDYLDING